MEEARVDELSGQVRHGRGGESHLFGDLGPGAAGVEQHVAEDEAGVALLESDERFPAVGVSRHSRPGRTGCRLDFVHRRALGAQSVVLGDEQRDGGQVGEDKLLGVGEELVALGRVLFSAGPGEEVVDLRIAVLRDLVAVTAGLILAEELVGALVRPAPQPVGRAFELAGGPLLRELGRQDGIEFDLDAEVVLDLADDGLDDLVAAAAGVGDGQSAGEAGLLEQLLGLGGVEGARFAGTLLVGLELGGSSESEGWPWPLRRASTIFCRSIDIDTALRKSGSLYSSR